jgi:alpha,alpha-trehalase
MDASGAKGTREEDMGRRIELLDKVGTPPCALQRFEEIARRLEGTRMALFLDYDGTLTPIVERPEQADLDEDVRGILEKASRRCPVAIISGRDLDDVRSRVQIAGLYYAGSHGFEIQGPRGLSLQRPPGRVLPVLDEAGRDLRHALEGITGAQIEQKRFSIAAHYRNVAAREVGRVKDAVKRIADAHPDLRIGAGKKVIELQPAIDWHKGKAVLWLLKVLDLDCPEFLPLYIGDDTTDEDVFHALGADGLTIRVEDGTGDTQAQYVLADTNEVKCFLEKLVSLLEEAKA